MILMLLIENMMKVILVTVTQSLSSKKSRWRREKVMTIGMNNAMSAKKTVMSYAVRHALKSAILNAQALNINLGVTGSVISALLRNADDLSMLLL